MSFQYTNFIPFFKNNTEVYIFFIIIIIGIIYITMILLIIIIYNLNYIVSKKLLWIISVLRFLLPFISYLFFGQFFSFFISLFYCRKEESYESPYLSCLTGLWIYSLAPASIIAMIFEIIIGFITNSLYYKPIFIDGSDILKKTNSFPDIIFMFTKIIIFLLFILDKGEENEHWAMLSFLIIITGINAYCTLTFKHRQNKMLMMTCNIFALLSFLGFFTLFIGKILKLLDFDGLIYLLVLDIVIIILYNFLYKNHELDFLDIDYKNINNPDEYLNYITKFYSIIKTNNNKRNPSTILKSLISKLEEKCYDPDCPLKKYLDNLSKGNEFKYFLFQYCEKIYQFGISKFKKNINLKYNFAIFLIMEMRNKRKASMLFNCIKDKLISFQMNYNIYRCKNMIDNFYIKNSNENYFINQYRNNILKLKSSISKATFLQYEFLTLILASKIKKDDNFKKLNKLGNQIIQFNKEIDEIYAELVNSKICNADEINLYSDYVEKILEDEEKYENCKAIKNLIYSNNIISIENDFSNFKINILKENDNLLFLVVSAELNDLGTIKDCSSNLCNIFSFQKEELIGNNINILIPEIFHKRHNLMLNEKTQKYKLKFFESLSKKEVYSPDYFQKHLYGIAKSKFLIPIKINAYFIKTEENDLVYIIEINKLNPLIINNQNKILDCCVLTDDNFIIQSFTANCINILKMSYKNINSNCDIVTYIKEFHDEYLSDINTAHLFKSTSIFTNERSSLHDSSFITQKKLKKNKISPLAMKSIKTDILNKSFSKKCKITWMYNKLDVGLSLKNKRNLFIKRDSVFGRRELMKQTINNENEEEFVMEIKKIIIENELLGYYFCFSKLNYDDYTNHGINLLVNIKDLYSKGYHLANVEIGKPINQTNIVSNQAPLAELNNRGKGRRQSLDKSYLKFGTVKNKDHNDKNSPDNYIPNCHCHFMFDINTFSYNHSNNLSHDSLLNETLKNEALTKLQKYQYQINSSKDESNSSSSNTESDVSGSENEEEEEDSSYISPKSSSSRYIRHQKDINNKNESLNNSQNNKEEKKDEKKDEKNNGKKDEEKEEKNEEKKDEIIVNSLNFKPNANSQKRIEVQNTVNSKTKDNNEILDSIRRVNNRESSKKIKIINNIHSSYYKVNIEKIHFMIFDFYKEIFIEGDKNEKVSKIDHLLKIGKNDYNNIISKDKKYPFVVMPKSKTEKSKELSEDIIIEKRDKILNEQKLLEKRITEAINKRQDEEPIKKLKIFSFLYFIVMIALCGLFFFFILNFYSTLKQLLNLVKNIVKIKYCDRMSAFYVGESSLLNYKMYRIVGGTFYNIPASINNKEGYIALMRQKIKESFLVNQEALQSILSSKLKLSKNTTKYINEIVLNTDFIMNDGHIEIVSGDVFSTLMQYNGAFYNLATSPLDLEQNHTDFLNFLHNSFNDYARGINTLIEYYSYELEYQISSIDIKLIGGLIIYFLIYIFIYFLITFYFISASKIRVRYMDIFYGINEDILKILITNCEKLFKKLKHTEMLNEDEENSIDSADEKMAYANTKKDNQSKLDRRKSLFYIKHSQTFTDVKVKTKLPYNTIKFIIIFAFVLLVTYIFFIYNVIYFINVSKQTISMSKYFYKTQNFHSDMLDIFLAYRQYVFDDSVIIYNMLPFDYLDKTEKGSYETLSEDVQFINDFLKKNLLDDKEVQENLKKKYCSYKYTDKFNSFEECQERFGHILNYDFSIIASNFIEELRVNKFFVQYLIGSGVLKGSLNDYDEEKFLKDECVPRVGQNYTGNYTFRLDLYNNETIHAHLDLVFVNIILPYIEINSKIIIPHLTIDNKENVLYITTFFYLAFIILVYFVYLLLMIKSINDRIYKTKNMLKLIPIHILSTQNNIKDLLHLSQS